MPQKKKIVEAQAEMFDAGRAKANAQKVYTAKVAKDLVLLARKVSVLKEQTQEEYIAPILEHCVALVRDEVATKGIRGVRDRSAVVAEFESRGGFSTFITSEEISTALTSLAGQCLTSVAKLVDPYLRKMLEEDYRYTLDEVAACNAMGIKAKFGKFIWERIEEYNIGRKWDSGALYTIGMGNWPSFKAHGIGPDDTLILRRSIPQVDDTVLVWTGNGIRDVDPPALLRVESRSGDVIRLEPLGPKQRHMELNISVHDDRERIAGVLVRVEKDDRPNAGVVDYSGLLDRKEIQVMRRLFEYYKLRGFTEEDIEDYLDKIEPILFGSDDDPPPVAKGKTKKRSK